MKIRKFILGYYAVLFLAFGVAGLFLPEKITDLIGYEILSSSAKIEFMATYGGLFLGLGAFMLFCTRNNITIGLISVLFTMGAMLLTRLAGYSFIGGADTIQSIYLAGETFTVVLVAFLLINQPRHSQYSF